MKKHINVNVVVIGGGPAGYSAAFRCSDLGLSVLIIEKYGVLGGTCLNVGCIPSKSLLYLTNLIKEIKEFSKYNINLGNSNELDISQIMCWKNNIINKLNRGLSDMAKHRKVNILQGTANFLTKNLIEVIHKDIVYNVQFDNAVIATGSAPILLPNILYNNDSRIWSSTDALNCTVIPKNLLIIGAGVIGLEMATIYNSLGSQVDIIDSSTRFFPSIDKDISDMFVQYTKNDFNIYLNTSVVNLIANSSGIILKTKKDSDILQNKLYNNVLISIGRNANTNNLNLSSIGIKLNSLGFIKVNSQMRTNVSNIFAVGDVVGAPMVAHKGIHEAHIAAEVISGKNHFFEPKVIPCIAYCDPEIAWTGITEENAKLKGINCRSVIMPWKFSGKAISSNCSENGVTKLIVDTDSHRVIGGIIVGRHAGELLSEINLAIEMGCDIEDIALTIHSHPSLSESINISAQLFNGTATDIINKI
ncbi:Dihydrolipoyl dehydrogenase [Buchnera aphidicola (Cinara kochiana kochiana)]|uniref:Dihydrolipoyl dehydrogenase n=1 Tax=Buchnera aphidicola (Cinara kochiana kochiana) TaxID=2518976 RepID=A0A451D5J2_9GAMM|nr:dihydrolipoyl dehydrogenase [Buchnera aphidicola]VFP81057.1 Dihydrolipoyl dehydrogenase [Buchnera aphidicola (Cinara kochiana kochiana)]